jgi:hypothetical protein
VKVHTKLIQSSSRIERSFPLVKNIINKERENVEVNGKMLLFMVGDYLEDNEDNDDIGKFTKEITEINKIFNEYKITANLYAKIMIYEEYGNVVDLKFNYTPPLVINDIALMRLVDLIYNQYLDYINKSDINGRLSSLGINIRIVRKNGKLNQEPPKFVDGELYVEMKKKAVAKVTIPPPDYYEVVKIYPESFKTEIIE